MRVKKFEAKSMKEALQMVKHELGPDAVILGARDNRRFGLAGEASVEVTAAVSESTLHKKHFVESRLTAGDRAKFAGSNAKTQRAIIEQMVDNRKRQNEQVAASEKPRRAITSQSYIDIEDEDDQPSPRRRSALDKVSGRNVRELLDGFEQSFDPRFERSKAGLAPSPQPAMRTSDFSEPPPSSMADRAKARIRAAARDAWKSNPFMEEEKVQVVKTTKPKPAIPQADNAHQSVSAPVSGQSSEIGTKSPSQGEIQNLKSEISRLEKMLEGFQKVPQSFSISSMHPGAEFGIGFDFSFMFQKLREAGITVDNIVDILSIAAKEIDPINSKKRSIVDAWVARYLLSGIQIAPNPFQGRMQLFVGGAGSGKTASLVKMASHLVVKEKKRIAILTTDSVKVGAVDQLKIYCQILNVPFAVIRHRKDWEWVLGQLPHVDHVLVDFPGLQLRDLDEIHLLKSLLPPDGNAPITHFCVSATSKDGDAYEIAKRYRVTDFNDLIVTNLDQSVQHGIIYNLQKKTGRKLHSFGIGNRIPEDFEVASKERVLDLIFKLSKLKRETR